MTDWLPIESAPKDGTVVLGYHGVDCDGGSIMLPVKWDRNWRGHDGWDLVWICWGDETTEAEPTHWMPLPEPPK